MSDTAPAPLPLGELLARLSRLHPTQIDLSLTRMQRLLAQLERRRREEEQKALSQGRAPEPYTGDFARGKGSLDWPVRGSLVGRFGPEKHPRFGTTVVNNGIDIASSGAFM